MADRSLAAAALGEDPAWILGSDIYALSVGAEGGFVLRRFDEQGSEVAQWCGPDRDALEKEIPRPRLPLGCHPQADARSVMGVWLA